MADFKIFKDENDYFNSIRGDKTGINGCTQEFIDYMEITVEECERTNKTNRFCLNCYYCEDCNGCINCLGCKKCKICRNCEDCFDCDRCENCEDLSHGKDKVKKPNKKGNIPPTRVGFKKNPRVQIFKDYNDYLAKRKTFKTENGVLVTQNGVSEKFFNKWYDGDTNYLIYCYDIHGESMGKGKNVKDYKINLDINVENEYCSGCWNCLGCFECDNCVECIECKNCQYCDYCEDCERCDNCANLKSEFKKTDIEG